MIKILDLGHSFKIRWDNLAVSRIYKCESVLKTRQELWDHIVLRQPELNSGNIDHAMAALERRK